MNAATRAADQCQLAQKSFTALHAWVGRISTFIKLSQNNNFVNRPFFVDFVINV